MQVLTLNNSLLNSHSKELASKVLKSSWQPELVIGIRTGGLYVAKPLYNELQKNHDTLYNEVSLSRPSTKKKKKLKVDKVLKKLPYFLLNLLRNLEVYLFEKSKAKHYINSRESDIQIDNILHQQILSCNKILLVDDAMDTGTTVVAIKNRFLSLNRDAEIKIAVLTITHETPFIDADYSLYNRVLLRCPWAQDYKESD